MTTPFGRQNSFPNDPLANTYPHPSNTAPSLLDAVCENDIRFPESKRVEALQPSLDPSMVNREYVPERPPKMDRNRRSVDNSNTALIDVVIAVPDYS